ncbi:hypothetical protein GCM10010515_28960 [Streptomyces fructofermentans]|uniref:Uncharacterized protein n=1 Tax=Streptomyces fructofermentans TaxID=152141 RepID=A0A918KEC9_9ACTN|nr:hypothetical protein GCM10010515_28960 [Streptomyces fructofermentans]
MEHVLGLAGAGDLATLSRALLFPEGWCDEGFGVMTVLRGLPEADRRVLARSFAGHMTTTRGGPDARRHALVLLAAVADGFADPSWCEAWDALLREKARRYWYSQVDDEMWTCAWALLDAGRPLSDEVIGLLRRSAKESWRPECMEPVLGRLHGPVLNAGEPWADCVLADLADLADLAVLDVPPAPGGPWHAVVEHALRAPVGRPTRAWDRRALVLADPLGRERVRDTATPWLEVAAEGGGGTDGAYDPYNLPALAGLAWLLSLLPPDPATIRALGALVERPPSRTSLTGTAVRALGRLPHRLGHPELERLSARVAHKVTHRQIREALEVRGAPEG